MFAYEGLRKEESNRWKFYFLHVHRTAMTSSISASMKSHSVALAQSVTLRTSRQGNSEAAILSILDSYLVSRTPISAAEGGTMMVVTTGLTFVQKRKSNVRGRSSLEFGPNVSRTA